MQVAQTMLSQLGGNRFIAMTGAQCSPDQNTLIVKLPRSVVLVIELMGDDTYTLKAGKRASMQAILQGKPAVKWGKVSESIYSDDLQSEFTALTGLDTHI